MARTLVLLRHGESEWNLKNLFTGWYDCDLSPKGEAEAAAGGRLMLERGVLPEVLHTSVLVRAIRHHQGHRVLAYGSKTVVFEQPAI